MTGSQFITYNLGENFTRDEFYEIFGEETTFPQVLCDGIKIGGSVETIKFLKEQKVV